MSANQHVTCRNDMASLCFSLEGTVISAALKPKQCSSLSLLVSFSALELSQKAILHTIVDANSLSVHVNLCALNSMTSFPLDASGPFKQKRFEVVNRSDYIKGLPFPAPLSSNTFAYVTVPACQEQRRAQGEEVDVAAPGQPHTLVL
eukprot:749340-Amphidinium_carterae.1